MDPAVQQRMVENRNRMFGGFMQRVAPRLAQGQYRPNTTPNPTPQTMRPGMAYAQPYPTPGQAGFRPNMPAQGVPQTRLGQQMRQSVANIMNRRPGSQEGSSTVDIYMGMDPREMTAQPEPNMDALMRLRSQRQSLMSRFMR